MSFAIGWMSHYQIKNMLLNITTIEDKNEGFASVNPFDKGKAENARQVFGGLKLVDFILPRLGMEQFELLEEAEIEKLQLKNNN